MADEIVWEGVADFEVALARIVAAADVAARETVEEGGKLIVQATRAHMGGRPGPETRSGRLFESVATGQAEQVSPGVWRSRTAPGETGAGTPYERRIELGFHGADALGRLYDQPPYPYLRPGLEDATPLIAALSVRAFRAAIQA